MITIKNEYGELTICIGKTYDFDLVDVASGEPTPVSEVEVLGHTAEAIEVKREGGKSFYIDKKVIVHETLVED